MACVRRNCALLAILTALTQYVAADMEYIAVPYLVSSPDSVVLPQGFNTLLSCEMNIEPDKFQWKFYPSDDPFDSKVNIFLSNDTFRLIPEDEFRVIKKTKAELSIQLHKNVTGDYQCLAYYGAAVVASVPWRISLAKMGPVPMQKDISISVQTGNTVNWRCNVPESNPPAYVDYKKGDKYVAHPVETIGSRVRSMILTNVSVTDSGTYRCTTTNKFEKVNLHPVLNLEVLNNGPMKAPSFVTTPLGEYTAIKGSTLFLECSAVGRPIPKVTWFKKQSQLPSNRTEIIPGGLIVKNVTSKDDGVYVCEYSNAHGSVTHQITVKYNEAPSIDCYMNLTDIKQGENMDIECDVRGTPEPQITWFLNGFSVLNDSEIEAIGNKIYFRPIEKRHAGNLQIFARNIVEIIYSSISIRVIPLTTSIDEIPKSVHNHSRHKNKKYHNSRKMSKAPKMNPPSRPVISGVNDETVIVRWNISNNNNGLSIQFFKVQYKDIGSGNGWNTANTDIAPTITAYEISDLEPDHFYKFRVAAVFSNNDYKMSPTSRKFHLRRLDFDKKNPLPLCLITQVETVNHTAIKIYWECPPYNVTVDGFYVDHIIATRAGDDHMITTVEGEDVRSYVINHLQPETSYDIKLQSFNQKLAGEFSPLMKGRTGVNPISPPVTNIPTTSNTRKTSMEPSSPDTNIYIIIAGGVICFALVITGLILLFVCRKWKRNKLTDNQDKPNVEHHIQADGPDYMVEQKSIPRSNGCATPGNRITITSNPLADTDKNPTVIEMRNLANNNVRHQSDPLCTIPNDGHSNALSNEKHRQHRKSDLKGNGEDCSTGSNYV